MVKSSECWPIHKQQKGKKKAVRLCLHYASSRKTTGKKAASKAENEADFMKP